MKGARKLRRYVDKMFDADQVYKDKHVMHVESLCFIGDELGDLQVFCKSHNFFYWINSLDNKLVISIMESP